MEILDAEWQWDRRKLTFYYTAETRVDFRELVRELFRIWKTRVWLCVHDRLSFLDSAREMKADLCLPAAAASTSNNPRSTFSKELQPIVDFSLSPALTIYLARPNNLFPETNSRSKNNNRDGLMYNRDIRFLGGPPLFVNRRSALLVNPFPFPPPHRILHSHTSTPRLYSCVIPTALFLLFPSLLCRLPLFYIEACHVFPSFLRFSDSLPPPLSRFNVTRVRVEQCRLPS